MSYLVIPMITAIIGFSFIQIFGAMIGDFSSWTYRMSEIYPFFPVIPQTLIYMFLICVGVMMLAAYYRLIRWRGK